MTNEKKTNKKRNGVIQRGKEWSVFVDLGDQTYRRCPTCRKRYWITEGKQEPEICTKDATPLDPVTSGRRQEWRSGFARKADAVAARDAARVAIREKTFAVRTDETVADFLRDWLTNRVNLRATTRANYEVCIEKYVVPRIGSVKLRDLTPGSLDRLYSDLSRSGGRGGRSLKPKTVRNVHLVLHRALASAVKARKLTYNPADGCDAVPAAEARQVREKRMRERIWSPAEIRTFLASVRDDRLYAAYRLFAVCGLRRSEVLGLPWSAVSLDDGTIRIEQGLVMLNRVPTITPTKSDASAAPLSIDSETVAALREHKKRQAEERLAAGPAYDGSPGLVFLDVLGEVVSPEAFLRAFRRHSRSAGLRECRIHDLRHSYASLLLSAGVDMKTISERLRHAGIGITADLYTHLSPEVDRAAAEAGAAFLQGS